MFQRNFIVNGEDVNDFMVMQNFAYLKYSSKMIAVFLLEKGFSSIKLNTMNVNWQKSSEKLTKSANLMFMQNFKVGLHFDSTLDNKTAVFVLFYDLKDTLVAEIQTTIHFIDCASWQFINTPKQIEKHFLLADVYGKVG